MPQKFAVPTGRAAHKSPGPKLRFNYARTLYMDPSATLDDLREAVNTLEETARTARRVFGGAHPTTGLIKGTLHSARAALAARET